MTDIFSVLLSLYARENPNFLRKSLRSLVTQTLLPHKIIVVKDGRLTDDLNKILAEFEEEFPSLFLIVGYEKNKGLGEALNYGLNFVGTSLVARMDTDDIAEKTRFETQVKYMVSHPEIDLLGSWIAEFKDDPERTYRIKKAPELHQQIVVLAKIRNPVNHMTVIFRKEKVQAAGGYQHAPFFEDYDLWVRMLKKGMIFHNLQEPLIKARIGNDMLGKRHGWAYMKHEYRHFKGMQRLGFISSYQFIIIALLRFPLRLIPKKILSIFYTFALRKGA